MERKSYKGIDIGKLICALLVVSIHCQFLMDKGEHLYRLYSTLVSGVAVPFFFICNGYFLENKMQHCKDIADIRMTITKQINKILLPYFVFGGGYFLLNIIILWKIDGNNVENAIRQQLWRWIVTSPGGPMWYLQSLLLTLCILYFIYRPNKLNAILVGFFILFSFPYICTLPALKDSMLRILYDGYKERFTTQSFLFRGFWIIWGMKVRRVIDDRSFIKKPTLILLLMGIAIATLQSEFSFNRWMYALTPICLVIYISAFFVKMKMLTVRMVSTVVIRKLSIVVFYIHFAVIYIVKFGSKLLGKELGFTSLFIITSFLSIGVAWYIVKMDCRSFNKIFGL